MESGTTVDLEAAVREFFLKAGFWTEEPDALTSETHLLERGVLDSLNVIGLVDYIEETYNFELEPSEIQQFTTIGNIARIVRSRLAA
jgi:acyl carrier protein